MGGQACVLYGAAEFSKDVDFAILCEVENLARLQNALDELQARPIAVPPFDADYLRRGHAVHFRCKRSDIEDLRVDVMSKMRGVDEFSLIWERRTTFELVNGESIEVMEVTDLVRAKKTQRTKDWPMIERLVANNYFSNRHIPTSMHVAFWLEEARTPAILSAVATHFSDVKTLREAANLARAGAKEAEIDAALKREEERERELDREYWAPLKAELEALRRARRNRF